MKFSLGGMTKFSLTTKLKRNIQEGYLCKESKDTIFIRTFTENRATVFRTVIS